MQTETADDEPPGALPGAQPWYRAPIAWLGIAVFIALLAGCIAVIVMADLYADEALPVAGERVLKMPTSHGIPAPPPSP